ncbi:MAG TPA: response regulator transcription factor [Terriglobales bacterium]|nr:response regulator transcription factor [Terriglobales bacterium]
MESKKRILIVDDEPQITRVLRTSLNSSGYDVRTANNGQEAAAMVREWTPDLVITDVAMPLVNGIDLTRRLRVDYDMPIIVLSVKGEEKTKVEALDAGADDYVTKPIGMNELLARVRRNLARVELAEPVAQVFEVGDFRIDQDAFRVAIRGQDVRLTPKEFELLLHLARNAGRVVTHRKLLNAIWGPNSVEQPEHLRVLVGQLRKKLETEDSPHYIITEPWVGYRLEPSGENGRGI